VVAVLIVIEITTFTTYARREIVWAYPGFYDQPAYLLATYGLNRDFSSLGLSKATRLYFKRSHATGVLLPLQAAVHGAVLGPGRLAALSVNFVHFAFFQCVFVATLLWVSRNWWVALSGFGLTLALNTVFQYAGGAFDFRMDFVSFCLFGVFLCALVRSRLLSSPRGSALVGGAGTILVLFRFLTAAYLGAILSAIAAGLVIEWFRTAEPQVREQTRRRFRGWLIATGILVIGTWPTLLSQRKAIYAYYVVGHITSSEKEIRAAEYGVEDRSNAALFYPRSIYRDHTGEAFWWLTGGLIAVGVFGRRWGAGTQAKGRTDVLRVVLPVAALGFVGPFVVLNANAMKSPVVGIICVPALLWAVLAPLVATASQTRRPELVRGVGIVALVGGFLTLLNQATAPAYYTRFDDPLTMRVLDDLIGACEKKGNPSPELFLDTHTQEFLAPVLQLTEFEKYGCWREYRDAGLSIFAGNEEEEFQRLLRADLVILAGRPAGMPNYPYDEVLKRMRPRVRAYCDAHLLKVGEYRIAGRIVTTYVRRRLRVESAAPDGWITDEGVRLVGTLADLKGCHRIELRRVGLNVLGRVPGVIAEVQLADRPPRPLAASVTADLGAVCLEWEPVDLPEATPVTIRIRFDASFVPRERGISPDPRSLVMYLGPQPRSYLVLAKDGS
jgi:hypothetical protein